MADLSSMRSAAAFLLVFGAAFAAPGVWQWREHRRILETWPEATARAVRSEIIHHSGKSGGTHAVQYILRYSASGREYEIPFTGSSRHGRRERAEREAQRHEEGTVHRIRYDPNEPFNAREDVGPTLRFFLLPALFSGIGALLLILGGGLLIWAGTRPPGPCCLACAAPLDRHFRFCARCGIGRWRDVAPEGPEDEHWDARKLAGERAVRESAEARRAIVGNRIGGVAFGLIGATLLIAAGALLARRYEVATAWIEATGTVTRSELDLRSGPQGQWTFRPRVELRYEGAAAQRLAEARFERDHGYVAARRLVERNPVGAHRTIRRNPEAPGEIVLEAPLDPESYVVEAVLGLLGAVFTPLGLVLLYQGFAARPAFCRSCRRLLKRRRGYCVHCGAEAALGI